MSTGILSRARSAAVAALAAVVLGAVAAPALAQAAWPLVYEGRIFDERGRPLEAPVTLTFRLYDAPDGGAPVWSETLPDVVVAAGDFAVLLGVVEPLPSDLPAEASLYLGVEVDGDAEQRPRTPIGAALRARFADLAERARRVTGGVVDATELRVGGRLVVDGDGQWVGGAAGLQGPAGLACWDLDADGVADANEDLNGDGRLTAVDCRGGGAAGGDTLAELSCGVGDMVIRTAGGWACDPHARDPDAHHSALSAGLDIVPNSVTLPADTALTAGSLRLGPQNDQVLTAGALASLTGGPGMSADHLHSHAGQGAQAVPSGKFLGLTAATYNGDMGGRFGVTAKCSAEFPNSRQCSFCEIMQSNITGLAGQAWVRGTAVCSPRDENNFTNLCASFDNVSGFGTEFTFAGRRQVYNERALDMRGLTVAIPGQMSSAFCDAMLPIACCAN
jgi:hypothetical protein